MGKSLVGAIRDVERLTTENRRLRQALIAASPTIRRPSHEHPTCTCSPCQIWRQVQTALSSE
jgi:hypothetical protein